MPASDFVVVGEIVGVHGLRGNLKVVLGAGDDSCCLVMDRVYLRHPGAAEEARRICSIQAHRRGYLMTLEGIDDRDSAQAQVGARLVVPKKDLPPLDEGEFYWHELIGISVYERQRYLGTIASIMETGSNDVYVVKDGDKETLVPALESVIQTVDLQKGAMQVVLPEGL